MDGQHFSHLQSIDCDIDIFQVLQCRKKNSLWLHEQKKRETETEIKQNLILTMATIGFRKRQRLLVNRFINLCNVKAKSSYLSLVFNYLSNLFNLLPQKAFFIRIRTRIVIFNGIKAHPSFFFFCFGFLFLLLPPPSSLAASSSSSVTVSLLVAPPPPSLPPDSQCFFLQSRLSSAAAFCFLLRLRFLKSSG